MRKSKPPYIENQPVGSESDHGSVTAPDPARKHRAHRTSPAINRRSFMLRAGVSAAGAAAFRWDGLGGGSRVQASEIGPQGSEERRKSARQIRIDSAQLAFDRPLPPHPDNGEEKDYPYLANYAKSLPQNDLGEVDAGAYGLMLLALSSGQRNDFEAIPQGGTRKLRNPQAGLAFDLEGPDSHHLTLPPAPRIDRAENSSEMAELYWMALARDVNFTDYAISPVIAAAAADLSKLSDFRGPKQSGMVTPATIFRGNTPGDLAGPYLSQFLLRPVPYGSMTLTQRQQTVVPTIEYLTEYATWLSIQRGGPARTPDLFDVTPRHVRNGRDMGQYVHVDAPYSAYLNAALILGGLGAPVDSGNPYLGLTKTDPTPTFGVAHLHSLLAEASHRASKAAWFQKWYVHRRLRPEAFGGLIHNYLRGGARYPINPEIFNTQALMEIPRKYGTYLLPQAFPEGSPTHPAYPAAHGVVAGACVTILKAWFAESFVLTNPVIPSLDGTSLVPYSGLDAASLTVGGELNKLATNVANGRNFAGIHWRSDSIEGLKLGEQVALGIIEENKPTYIEGGSFTVTRFDGSTVTI